MNRNLLVLAAAAGLLAGTTAVQAQAARDRSGVTPGHMMQEHGNVPGHPGASGFAPGHDRDDLRKGDRDDRMTGAGDRDDMRRGDRDDMHRGDRDDFRKGDRDDFHKGDRDDR